MSGPPELLEVGLPQVVSPLGRESVRDFRLLSVVGPLPSLQEGLPLVVGWPLLGLELGLPPQVGRLLVLNRIVLNRIVLNRKASQGEKPFPLFLPKQPAGFLQGVRQKPKVGRQRKRRMPLQLADSPPETPPPGGKRWSPPGETPQPLECPVHLLGKKVAHSRVYAPIGGEKITVVIL